MRKLLIALLALLLILGVSCASAANDSPAALARSMGYSPETSDNGSIALRCDFRICTTQKAKVIWSDFDTLYTVTGPWADMARLYLDILDRGDWLTCRYIVGNKARYTYNARAKRVYEPLSNYRQRVEVLLGEVIEACATPAPTVQPTAQPTATPIPYEEQAHDYVLNRKTGVFHDPDCGDVKRMNEENKKYLTKTRDYMIKHGYDPCDHCNP